MDLSYIPVIDHHTHILSPVRKGDDVSFVFTAYPMDALHLHSSMAYRMMISELRRFFTMPGASAEDVMAERNRRYDEDARGYIQSLMKDAGVRTLICDLDSPVSAYWTGRYRTDREAFDYFSLMEPEVATGRVLRIEVACNRRLKDGLAFDAFVRAFHEDLERDIALFHAIALKSIIGYFTGLAVTHPSREEAAAAYERFLRDREDADSEKVWRDYMLHEGASVCLEKNMPLQIHTGFGDTPYCDLKRLSPFLLYDFLKEEPVRRTTVVLLHAGYPYVRETGILTSQLPRVYADFSELLPYASHAAESALPELLETAPTSKILFGTDGGTNPEPVWFGSVYARRALSSILDSWVSRGFVSEPEAYGIAEDLLYRNALSLYPSLSV